MAINAANGCERKVDPRRPFVESRSQRALVGQTSRSTVGLVMLAVWFVRDVLTALTWAAGAFHGIAYVICDVPHPLLFVGLTVASAMVPLGAWISIDRRCVEAAALWREWACKRRAARNRSGVLMIGDSVVLPAVVGEAARVPFLLVLIGMLGGGLQSFGWIVFSLDRSLWQWSLRCGANGSTATIELR
jgi:hypothetical protein